MLLYLASPYTPKGVFLSEDQKQRIKHERFVEVCKVAAEYMKREYEVFCPIAHSHPIEFHGMDKPESEAFWLKQDFAILERCQALVVVQLPGWEKSSGVAKEMAFATKLGIPVIYHPIPIEDAAAA